MEQQASAAMLADLPVESHDQRENDRLDFAPYADTIAGLILDPNTETPLTVGIFGSWGSGKTSLMKMIERRLLAPPDQANGAAPSARVTHTVWFNAWLYSKEEALWRSLLARVIDGVGKMGVGKASERRERRSRLTELAAQLYRVVEPGEGGSLAISAGNLLDDQAQTSDAQLTMTLKQGLDLLEAIARAKESAQESGEGAAQAASTLRERVNQATAAMEQARIQSLERIQELFESLVKEFVLPYGYLVIFVDDLDRCLPEKAVEVLEAIKLFFDVPGCIFVLGIDRDVIERGIRLRYGELGERRDGETLPFLLSPDVVNGALPVAAYREFIQKLLRGEDEVIDGGRYLEKIIQIPFALPPISRDTLTRYVLDLAPGLPDSRCALVFARGLEPNPRQVKRALNIFTLLWNLAEHRKRIDPSLEISPVRLAKLVVLQQQHDELYTVLRSEPISLHMWEQWLRQSHEQAALDEWSQQQPTPLPPLETLPAALEGYSRLFALRDLLLMQPLSGPLSQEANFLDLSPDELEPYVFLSRTVREQGSPPLPPQQQHAAPLPSLVEESGADPQDEPLALGQGLNESLVVYLRRPLEELETLARELPADSGVDASRPALQRLAQLGGELVQQVLGDVGTRNRTPSEALAHRLERPLLIRIHSPQGQAQIPWEIGYDGPGLVPMGKGPPSPETPVDPSHFWGLRHLIERPLLADDGRRKVAPPTPHSQIEVGERPGVLLVRASEEPSEGDLLPELAERESQGEIALRVLPRLQALFAEGPAPLTILQGLKPRTGGYGEFTLELGESEPLNWRAMQANSPPYAERPPALLLLHIGIGVGQAREWPRWLEWFFGWGFHGVIAPLAATTPRASHEMGALLLKRLLAGMAVGEALRDARQAAMSQGNFQGLYVVHWGPATQRLSRPDAPKRQPVQALAGLRVAIAGTLPGLTHQQARTLIEANGGTVTSRLSTGTDFLLAGAAAGQRLAQAEAAGLPIVSWQALQERLGGAAQSRA